VVTNNHVVSGTLAVGIRFATGEVVPSLNRRTAPITTSPSSSCETPAICPADAYVFGAFDSLLLPFDSLYLQKFSQLICVGNFAKAAAPQRFSAPDSTFKASKSRNSL
jgi:hypothetical protein